MTQPQWDHEVDVLVIGAGAGGMAAAITAQIEGSSVLVLEKTDRIGGATAVSGGAVWAPLNSQSARVGHPDTFEKVWTYMQNTVGNAAPEDMQRAYLNACGEAVDFLDKNSEVKLAARAYSPDYHPDREGAAFGGRSMDPLMFDGRLLGKHFRELRDPLPEFTVLGGMMITLTDANHLLAAMRTFASWKASMKLVLRFFSDRLRGYHRGTRLVLGNALAARLFKTLLDRRIDYWLNSSLKSLITSDGKVTGVQIEREGRVLHIRAKRGVVRSCASSSIRSRPALGRCSRRRMSAKASISRLQRVRRSAPIMCRQRSGRPCRSLNVKTARRCAIPILCGTAQSPA
jgi:hypothetical protein